MSSSGPTSADPYSTITVDEVAFTGDTGPVTAEGVPDFALHSSFESLTFSTEEPAFVVGIHAVDPPVGSGDPQSLDSLIGFKILPTGEFEGIEVPIFPYFDNATLRPGQVFPPTPDGTTEIEGTLWHDINRAFNTSPSVIQIDGEVNAQASITDLDQNPSRDPIGEAPLDPAWNFAGGKGPDTFDEGDDPRFGEAVDTAGDVVAAGAPLEDHSTNVGSTYVLNGIFEELEPGEAGIGEDQIDEGAQFGSSVAIGPAVAVGAPNDNGGSGVVYVFGPGDDESLQLIKTISEDSPGNDLGAAVAVGLVEGNNDDLLARVLAGAPNADTGGKVKVVDIDETGAQKNEFSLSPNGLDPNAEFGSSIGTPSLFESGPGSPALIGAPGATPDGTDDAGKAYLYETVSGSASSEELTTASVETDARFGSAVDLGVDDDDLLLAVGAPGSSSGQGEASLFDVQDFFTESPDPPEREGAFDDPDGSPGDRLGAAVALTDNQNLVAGAPGGGYATLFDDFEGAVGHFTRPGDVPSFGTSVATSFSRVVIGAPAADGGGAAFIYESEDSGGIPG